MKTNVSCDRCHRIKAKCTFVPGEASCDRCSRLQHDCTTVRALAKRGRRRKDEKLLVSKDKTDALIWVVHGVHPNVDATNHDERHKETTHTPHNRHLTAPAPRLIPHELPPPEDQLLEILWSDNFVSDFVIGPTFAQFFQDMVRRSFAHSPGILRDTYLATAAAFAQIYNGEPGNESLNLNRISISIERLRRFRAKNRSQLALLSGFGLSIVTFEILTASSSSHAIVAHTLLSLKPWFPLSTADPDLDFNVNSLILMDIINCLIYREAPIIRYGPERIRIDRSVGLCCGFLPIMYDVCLVSHKQKHDLEPDQVKSAYNWTEIELEAQNWQPVEPPEFHETYQGNEIVAMRTQASIYQNAVLLLIYRLQHPYGGIENVGMSWSRCILSSLDTCFRVTGSYPLQSFFPLLMASLEITDYHTRDEIIGAVETRFQPSFCQFLTKFKCFVKYAWEARDCGCVFSWDQLVHTMPKIFFLP